MIFFSLQVLLNSKLHVDILGRVWDLSDIDNDGMLDKDEFSVVRKSHTFSLCSFVNSVVVWNQILNFDFVV